VFPWFWLSLTSITIYVFDHYFFVLFKLLLLSAFLKNNLGLILQNKIKRRKILKNRPLLVQVPSRVQVCNLNLEVYVFLGVVTVQLGMEIPVHKYLYQQHVGRTFGFAFAQ